MVPVTSCWQLRHDSLIFYTIATSWDCLLSCYLPVPDECVNDESSSLPLTIRLQACARWTVQVWLGSCHGLSIQLFLLIPLKVPSGDVPESNSIQVEPRKMCISHFKPRELCRCAHGPGRAGGGAPAARVMPVASVRGPAGASAG